MVEEMFIQMGGGDPRDLGARNFLLRDIITQLVKPLEKFRSPWGCVASPLMYFSHEIYEGHLNFHEKKSNHIH